MYKFYTQILLSKVNALIKTTKPYMHGLPNQVNLRRITYNKGIVKDVTLILRTIYTYIILSSRLRLKISSLKVYQPNQYFYSGV